MLERKQHLQDIYNEIHHAIEARIGRFLIGDRLNLAAPTVGTLPPTAGGTGGTQGVTIRGAADYDNSSAPADGQTVTWSAASGKFHPVTPAAPAMANPMTAQDDLIVGGASGVPARLGKGADGQVLTVDPATHHLIWATPAAGTGSWTQIAVQTLAAAAASVVFSGIPGTYRALLLIYAGSQVGSNFEENICLRANGDTAANYDYGQVYNDYLNSGVGTSQANGQTAGQVGNWPGTSSPAGSVTTGTVLIADYASTSRRKGYLADAQQQRDDGGNPAVYGRRWSGAGRWRSTAAITSLTLYSSTSNIASGSWFALYGLT